MTEGQAEELVTALVNFLEHRQTYKDRLGYLSEKAWQLSMQQSHAELVKTLARVTNG